VIDDLEEGHIIVTHNVACFYFIQKETNYLLKISDRNFKLLVEHSEYEGSAVSLPLPPLIY
jgi:hypothetical protein